MEHWIYTFKIQHIAYDFSSNIVPRLSLTFPQCHKIVPKRSDIVWNGNGLKQEDEDT